jgi:hypothetical protein
VVSTIVVAAQKHRVRRLNKQGYGAAAVRFFREALLPPERLLLLTHWAYPMPCDICDRRVGDLNGTE